jgi:hypothetical protein
MPFVFEKNLCPLAMPGNWWYWFIKNGWPLTIAGETPRQLLAALAGSHASLMQKGAWKIVQNLFSCHPEPSEGSRTF